MRNTFWSLHLFFKVLKGRFCKVLDLSETTNNRSDLTSRLAAVSRLGLLYVSENIGFGIL